MFVTRVNRLTLLAATGIVVGAGLVGCSADDAKNASAGGKISVLASDKECKIDTLDLQAGTHTFTVQNKGSKITEFYVYAVGDRVVGEVENISPGLTRELHVELCAGE